jgi:hypothetical protein
MLMDRTEFTASRESWVAFFISVAILVLFAFFMYQIHSTRIERVVETETDYFPDANPRTEISGIDIDPGTVLPRALAVKDCARVEPQRYQKHRRTQRLCPEEPGASSLSNRHI